MDGDSHWGELDGMAVEEMDEIVKRQDWALNNYRQNVCSKCPTKNCHKRKGESDLDYETRGTVVAISAQQQRIVDYLCASMPNVKTPQKELIWEDCMWNKYS